MPEHYRIVATEREVEALPVGEVEKLLQKQPGAERIFYGLDVGRVKDYSTLAVIVRHVMPTEADALVLVTRYYVVYLHRYPLMTPYEVVEADVERWWKWGSLTGIRQHFAMDMTGVGAPVWQGIRKRRVQAQGVTITAGVRESNPEPNLWDVPKATLVTYLVRTAQSGRLKMYKELPLYAEYAEELGSFGYKMNQETNTVSYESLSSQVHDDLVIAVALPVWYGERVVPYRMPAGGAGPDIENDYNPLG